MIPSADKRSRVALLLFLTSAIVSCAASLTNGEIRLPRPPGGADRRFRAIVSEVDFSSNSPADVYRGDSPGALAIKRATLDALANSGFFRSVEFGDARDASAADTLVVSLSVRAEEIGAFDWSLSWPAIFPAPLYWPLQMRQGEVRVTIQGDIFRDGWQIDHLNAQASAPYSVETYAFFRTAPIETAAERAYLGALRRLSNAMTAAGQRLQYSADGHKFIESLGVLPVDSEIFGADEIGAVTDKLRAAISGLELFRVQEREKTGALLNERKRRLADCGEECAGEIGRLLGVSHILGTRISRVGAINQITLRVIDTGNGTIVKYTDLQFTGTREQILTQGIPAAAEKFARSFRPKW